MTANPNYDYIPQAPDALPSPEPKVSLQRPDYLRGVPDLSETVSPIPEYPDLSAKELDAVYREQHSQVQQDMLDARRQSYIDLWGNTDRAEQEFQKYLDRTKPAVQAAPAQSKPADAPASLLAPSPTVPPATTKPAATPSKLATSYLSAEQLAALSAPTPADPDKAAAVMAQSIAALSAPSPTINSANHQSAPVADTKPSVVAANPNASKDALPAQAEPQVITADVAPGKLSWRERRAATKAAELAKSEADWAQARDLAIEHHVERMDKQVQARKESYAVATKMELDAHHRQGDMRNQEILQKQKMNDQLHSEALDAALKADTHEKRQGLIEQANYLDDLAWEELLDEKRAMTIEEPKRAQRFDSLEHALTYTREKLDLARDSYAADVAKTRGSTFYRGTLKNPTGYDRQQAGRFSRFTAGKTEWLNKTLREHGIVTVERPTPASQNSQFDYEVQVGVLKHYLKAKAADTFYDMDPAEQAECVGGSEAFQKEQVLNALLGFSSDRSDKHPDGIVTGELFLVNDLIRSHRTRNSNHFEGYRPYRKTAKNNNGSIDPGTVARPVRIELPQESFNHQDKFREARLKFYRKWHDWSQEGYRGAAKKAAAGSLFAAAGFGAAALGAPLIASGGVAAAVGTGIAMRLVRVAAVQRVNLGSDRIQADADYGTARSQYKEKVAATYETNADLSFGVDDFHKFITSHHTEQAVKQAKMNKRQVALGAAAAFGAFGIGHAFNLISTGSGSATSHIQLRSAGSTPASVNHGTGVAGSHANVQPSAGQGHTQGAGSFDTKPSANTGNTGTTGTVNPNAHPATPGQGHSQVGSNADSPKPSVTTNTNVAPKPEIPAAIPQPNLVSIPMTDVNDHYISQIYNHAFGQQGYAQMQIDANAAVNRGDLLKVLNDPNDPDNWYLKLTKQGASKLGMTDTSSKTADVMKLLSKGSTKFKLVA